MTPTKTTLQQQRAADALRNVKSLSNRDAKFQSEYVSYANSLPATIVMNGLGQALTMLLAKARGRIDDSHRVLFDHVAGWLQQQIVDLKTVNSDDVIERLMEHDQAVYIRAQAEAMAYLNWLKQFARAYLKESDR